MKRHAALDKLPILYEDQDLLVLNKPAGLVVQAGGRGDLEGKLKKRGKPFWLIHRLDKETSGVLLVAQSALLAQYLKKLFKKRLVRKEYLAWVEGKLSFGSGEINIPLKFAPRLSKTLPSREASAKWAKTIFRVEKETPKRSLVRLSPVTGRTHQIRAHLALIKHPIIGDTKYGASASSHLLLHALKISFKDPQGQKRSFSAPWPSYFR